MPRTVAILQSSYIPWRGYFDIIRRADEFLTFDVVQYTRRDWRNRNIIKGPNGAQWLTVPVDVKGRYGQAIDETRIADSGWAEQHLRAIDFNYRQAGAYGEVFPWLADTLREAGKEAFLTQSNHHLLTAVCDRLGLRTPIRRATELLPRESLISMDPTERLLQLCLAAGGTTYLSGPSARSYLDVEKFSDAGVAITWMDYSAYQPYPQCKGPFLPQVSIVDLLLNCGTGARDYLG
jgi:hypothetical protein